MGSILLASDVKGKPMNVQPEKIQRFIEFLEDMRRRKMVYFYPVNFDTGYNFLRGLLIGLTLAGWGTSLESYQQAYKTRGWEYTPAGGSGVAAKEMRKRGMTDEEILDEILLLEIEAWRLMSEQAV